MHVDTKEDRIVGGYTAAENKPWVVKVFLIKENSICGGTLINKRFHTIRIQTEEKKATVVASVSEGKCIQFLAAPAILH